MMDNAPAIFLVTPDQGLYPLIQASMEEVYPILVPSVDDMTTKALAPV